MASRYWVGTGNPGWDNTAGSKWSASSGGASGASAPGAGDDVFIDAASYAGDPPYCIVTLTDNVEIKSLTLTGFTGQVVIGGSYTLTINGGGLSIPSGMSFVNSGILKFTATSGSFNIIDINGNLTIDAAGASYTVSQASGAVSLNAVRLLAGTLNLTESDGTSIGSIESTGSGTRTLVLAGTITFKNGSGFTSPINFSGTNFTFTPGTSSLLMNNTDAASKQFIGGGKTFYDVTFGQTHTITGSNTFHDLTIAAGKTITLTAGTTQTISGTFTADGSSGSEITIQSSSAGTAANLAITTKGTLDYLIVSDNHASGAVPLLPTNSTNNGGNIGWFPSQAGIALFFDMYDN